MSSSSLISGSVRYLEEEPVEYKEDLDPTPQISKTSNSVFHRMKTLSQENTEDNEDDDSLEEDAKRTIEGKFLFHSRFHHVLNTLHRETTIPQPSQPRPVSSDGRDRNGDRGSGNMKPFQKTQYSPALSSPTTQSRTEFLNNLSNSRKSFSVFESSNNSPFDALKAVTDTAERDPFISAASSSASSVASASAATDSIGLSNSTFATEDSNQKRSLSSPRAAMIREGHVRHQIPYVVKELVGNVEVEQTAIISLAGQGIGDEKMLCMVQSLPYFVNVDEINISSTAFFLPLPPLLHSLTVSLLSPPPFR
jgi:hypothetical protein